jgi:hypothetical protein
MRKSIFKREIEHCFKLFGLNDKQQEDIKRALFVNPLDMTTQYLLKKELTNPKEITACLEKIISTTDFISDVRTLFEVKDDLELPAILREQLSKKEQFALFVGAGVSKLLNLLLWDELAVRAITYLHEINKISYVEAERIIYERTSPKQKMSIFHQILVKEDSKEFYEKYFIPTDKERLNRNPYDELVKIECPKFSSNLDNEFLNALNRKVELDRKAADISSSTPMPMHIFSGFNKDMGISTNAIYQVHGSYQYIEKYSVITMQDYLSYYFQDPERKLPAFFEKIFNEYVVLFIGYGMEEFEILRSLFNSKGKHHVLVSTYLNDANLLRVKKEYFETTLGINAHGFYLDFNGYDRLYDVIKSWVEKINFEIKGGFYQKTGEFEGVEL